MLELYHAEPLANSMKAILCLKEKHLAFESHYVNLLLFEQHEPDFLKINPNGQVPVLVHDGVAIDQSTTINEYLEDVFPEPRLRPADPALRAYMRNWNKLVDEYFCPAVSMWGWHVMVAQVARSIPPDRFQRLLERIPLKEQREKWATVAGASFSSDQLDDAKTRVGVVLAKMEARLGAAPWLNGDEYSLADVNTYSMVAGTLRLFPDIANAECTPATVDWFKRMGKRPAVQEAEAMPNLAQETLQRYRDGLV